MIFHLLRTFLIGIMFIDFLDRRFPNQLHNFLIELSYNCVFYYSRIQIFLVKMNNILNKFIENNPTLLKLRDDVKSLIQITHKHVTTYEFVKHGKKSDLNFTTEVKPDFMILSLLSDDKKCVNKKIIYSNEIEYDNIAETSDFQFMLVEMIIGSKPFKIDLKTDNFNYYVVGNKLSKSFFVFYLNEYLHYKHGINSDDKITLKIIDNDVNSVELIFTDKDEFIIFEKTGYKVSSIQ